MGIASNHDFPNYLRTTEVEDISVPDVLSKPFWNYKFETVSTVFRITAKYRHRLDRIASEQLGSASLDWVLWVANDNLIHLPDDVKPPREIIIPKQTEVAEFLDTFRRT